MMKFLQTRSEPLPPRYTHIDVKKHTAVKGSRGGVNFGGADL
jgi:hypothetical protein